jgi:hypothetical protein
MVKFDVDLEWLDAWEVQLGISWFGALGGFGLKRWSTSTVRKLWWVRLGEWWRSMLVWSDGQREWLIKHIGIRELGSLGFKEMVKINCKEGLMGAFRGIVKVNVGLEWLEA